MEDVKNRSKSHISRRERFGHTWQEATLKKNPPFLGPAFNCERRLH